MSRKNQIERDLTRRLIRRLRKECPAMPDTRGEYVGLVREQARVLVSTPEVRAIIREELKAAAMVGACAERDRTLQFLETFQQARQTVYPTALFKFIITRGVLDVLGYTEKSDMTKAKTPKLTRLEVRFDKHLQKWHCWQEDELIGRSFWLCDLIRTVRAYVKAEVEQGIWGFEVAIKLKNSRRYSKAGFTYPKSRDPKRSKG